MDLKVLFGPNHPVDLKKGIKTDIAEEEGDYSVLYQTWLDLEVCLLIMGSWMVCVF